MGLKTIRKQYAEHVLICLAWILFFASCTSSGQTESVGEPDHSIAVKAEAVTMNPIPNEINISGNIEGKTTVKLGFMVPGKINMILTKAGQAVSKGQLIATLEPTNYALSKQLAEVQVSEANDEYRRLKLLYGRGSLSESDFIKATAGLEKARVQEKLEAKNLQDTRLYSPVNGVLLNKQTEVGEIINAGTVLFIVSDIKKVTVLAFVPEGDLNGLHIGQAARVTVAALNKSFTGKITEVGAIADAASRAFTVKIEVENPGLYIRPGMIAEARIAVTGYKPAIQLPTESIIHEQANQSYVFVIDKERKKSFKRKVSLGKMVANKIEILSGLSVGESVVVSGQNKLSDGSLITIESN